MEYWKITFAICPWDRFKKSAAKEKGMASAFPEPDDACRDSFKKDKIFEERDRLLEYHYKNDTIPGAQG